MKALVTVLRLLFTNRRALVAVAALAISAELSVPASAQAVCDSVTQPINSVCNDQNGITFIMPTTNTDGSPLNDYASVIAFFGPTTGVCTAPIASGTKNLGGLGVPATPLPNTKPRVALGTLGMTKGRNFVALKIVDLTGNASPCSPEVQFVYDPISPAPATGVTAGP